VKGKYVRENVPSRRNDLQRLKVHRGPEDDGESGTTAPGRSAGDREGGKKKRSGKSPSTRRPQRSTYQGGLHGESGTVEVLLRERGTTFHDPR